MAGFVSAQDFKQSARSSVRTVVGHVDFPADWPRFGGKRVNIGKPSAKERDRCLTALVGMKAEEGLYTARVVAAVACDEGGRKLFEAADEPWLADMEYDVLSPIVDKANALQLFADGTREQEKNSETTPAASSATASP